MFSIDHVNLFSLTTIYSTCVHTHVQDAQTLVHKGMSNKVMFYEIAIVFKIATLDIHIPHSAKQRNLKDPNEM